MYLMFLFMLLFSIILKVLPPKKPNYLYGYQLGSAKKSLEHWKIANRYASNYMIILYSIFFLLSIALDNKLYDYINWIMAPFLIGLVFIYFLIERRLKKIDETNSNNDLLK